MVFITNYALQVGIHILIFFLANLAKGNMSFCHHLVSDVCHPFTFCFDPSPSMADNRGEDFLEINQSETRIACGGHVCKWIGTK
jgi:hypothetical protein